MSERTRNVIVGLTTLLGFVGLLVLLMLFGYAPRFVEKGYRVTITLPDASGVSGGSRVRMAGIDIGEVTLVEFNGRPSNGVKVTAQINKGKDIPAGSKARADSPPIGGSGWIVIDLSEVPPDSDASIPKDGSAVLEGSRGSGAGFAGQIAGALKGPLAKFEEVADQFKILSKEWTDVGHNINQLSKPTAPGEVDAGKVQGNLSSLVARADRRLAELEKVLDGIDKLINDPQMRQDLKETIANAKSVSGDLKAGSEQIKSLADSTRGNIDVLTKRYVAVADDLSHAIDSMKKTLDDMREGEGTMGKFIKDPALYNNLNDASQRLGKTIDEMKLLIEKWKAEGLPVHF